MRTALLTLTILVAVLTTNAFCQRDSDSMESKIDRGLAYASVIGQPPFLDCTSKGKAFSRPSITLEQRGHILFPMPVRQAKTDLDPLLKALTSEPSVSAFPRMHLPLSIAYFDDAEGVKALYFFRDMKPAIAKRIAADFHASKRLSGDRARDRYRVIVSAKKPDLQWQHEVQTITADELLTFLAGKIEKHEDEYRFLVQPFYMWIVRTPDGAPRARQELIRKHHSEYIGLLTYLDHYEHPHTSLVLTSLYIEGTDRLFDSLQSIGGMDDKTTFYYLDWQGVRQQMTARGFVGPAIAFENNLLAATTNTKCTLSVTGSRGANADIKARKATAKVFEAYGPTVVHREVERAIYHFQSWRDGKQTGELGPVDCTDKSAEITILEK
jgi:hypothetical protein